MSPALGEGPTHRTKTQHLQAFERLTRYSREVAPAGNTHAGGSATQWVSGWRVGGSVDKAKLFSQALPIGIGAAGTRLKPTA
jgi:hypothetical protein